MIYSIGTDIVDIDRIKLAIERSGRPFLQRVFTDSEIMYCNSANNKYEHFAARFAAKEAVIKACSGSPRIGINEIEIRNRDNGAPCLVFHNNTKDFILAENIVNAHISMSHTKDYAVATVIFEKKEIG